MVNNANLRILPEDECDIQVTSDGRRKIANGPVYDLHQAQVEARTRQIVFVTADARDDQFNIGFPARKIKPFIAALREDDHYLDSERCSTSICQTALSAYDIDSDAYTMRWNLKLEREYHDKDTTKYYLKFGFSERSSGFLVVSIHESDYQ